MTYWLQRSHSTSMEPEWTKTGNTPHFEKEMDRHCAFCLILIPATQVKCCAQCHRRAYCSRKCQLKDWTPRNLKDGGTKGIGQGHKSWCGVPYGEEDLDWIVIPIEGKGQGITTTRFIPANSRIMVDGLNLEEDDTSNKEALILSNSLGGRSILVNHACDGNASRMADPDFMTMVLFTKRDIPPGEEICVNYIVYNETYAINPNPFVNDKFITSFADCRQILESRWKIVCPFNCFCHNDEIDKLIRDGRLMHASLLDEDNDEMTSEEAATDLELIHQMLQDHPKIHGSELQKAFLLDKAFDIAVRQKKTLRLAYKFIKEAYSIWSRILHPRGRCAKRAHKFMLDPKISEKYLIIEMDNGVD